MTGARTKILFSEAEIARGVERVARAIAARPLKPTLAAPILTGAFVFAADLMRALSREGLTLETEFLWLRSYGMAQTPGEVTVLKSPSDIVRGRTVLLIDGVLDSGATLAKARALLEEAGAGATIAAVAVRKTYPRRRRFRDVRGGRGVPVRLRHGQRRVGPRMSRHTHRGEIVCYEARSAV
jgi:hypoxanthine phosphoribosyltransferase